MLFTKNLHKYIFQTLFGKWTFCIKSIKSNFSCNFFWSWQLSRPSWWPLRRSSQSSQQRPCLAPAPHKKCDLRVLGSPNPGQSFGRGLSGPQATEVSRDPVGSWAATNLTVHSSNSFLGPSCWHGAPGYYSWIAFVAVFRFFRVF